MKSFKEFMEKDKPIIYIDLDETLIHTSKWYFNPYSIPMDMVESKNGVVLNINDSTYLSFPRPKAKEFLIECIKIARTVIITAGGGPFQREVVEKLELPVKEIYGFGEYHSAPKSKKSLLLDNAPLNDSKTLNKMFNLEMNENQYIPIKPWYADDENDDELMSVLPIIQTVIGSV